MHSVVRIFEKWTDASRCPANIDKCLTIYANNAFSNCTVKLVHESDSLLLFYPVVDFEIQEWIFVQLIVMITSSIPSSIVFLSPEDLLEKWILLLLVVNLEVAYCELDMVLFILRFVIADEVDVLPCKECQLSIDLLQNFLIT